ncbi:SRPBCC domain-containing protein [Fluviicola sp.]|uniref:SRPBCC family protein n=1 Tax=Fluviicola sp. TaxID=1917219 RepID=UPI00261D69DE|nr:SRPBCC domain-containing protein [Fluviicola sp.]
MITRNNNYELQMTNSEFLEYPQQIKKSILINNSVSKVWEYLTIPGLMQQWMGEMEMDIEILTDWKVGGPFIVKGFHHTPFENKGEILQWEPEIIFQYSHLSSLSNLPDEAENYTIITFQLNESDGQTELTIGAKNFPTESIYKHWEFYWNGTMHLLKQVIENGKFKN